MTTATHPGALDELPVYTIAPSRSWLPLDLGELWAYRELLYFLVWRAVKVRYKQTALGIAWAVIQPLFAAIVFSVFFGRFGKMPSDGLPYPIFAYCALLPWQLFAFSLTEASTSVVQNERLITKVYFPRLIIPISAVAVGAVDFGISCVVLAILMVYYGIAPGLAVITIPIWALLAILTALAVGLWLAALNVRYRDIRYTLPFIIQIWLFATPVAYSLSIVPEAWRSWYALNPMVGVVEAFRWAVLGKAGPPGVAVVISAGTVLALLVGGLAYFRHTERTFADIV